MGCNGGWPEYAANYLTATGIPSDQCEPYDLTNTTCPNTCVDGSAKKLYKYSSWRCVVAAATHVVMMMIMMCMCFRLPSAATIRPL